MENKIYWLFLRAKMFLNILLAVTKYVGTQFNITGLVYSMHISKCSCDSKQASYLFQLFISMCYFFRLCIKLVVFNPAIIPSIFFTASNTEFNFNSHSQWSHSFKKLNRSFNVFFEWFFR